MKRIEFSQRARTAIRERAQGRCQGLACKGLDRVLTPADGPQYDHILPAWLGGTSDPSNGQYLCKACHKAKTKDDVKRIRKTQRQRDKNLGGRKKHKWPWTDRFKRKPDGTVVER